MLLRKGKRFKILAKVTMDNPYVEAGEVKIGDIISTDDPTPNNQNLIRFISEQTKEEVWLYANEFEWLNKGDFEMKASQLGRLVDQKQKAYGNAVVQTYEVMRQFMKPYYQDGQYVIPESLLQHMLLQVRIIDKQNRIFNNPDGDLMDESPYSDLAGYGLLGSDIITKK